MSFKTLYIMRHSKAVPAGDGIDDHERVLTERGERDARTMGEYMREHGIVPDGVLCSSALRARQTLHFVEEGMGRTLNAKVERRLYMASPRDVLSLLALIEEPVGSLMIVGHNPTLHQLTADLTETGEKALLAELAKRFPTSTLAEIRYPAISWTEFGPRKGELRRFIAPKLMATA